MLNIHPKSTYEVGDINDESFVVMEVDFRYSTRLKTTQIGQSLNEMTSRQAIKVNEIVD